MTKFMLNYNFIAVRKEKVDWCLMKKLFDDFNHFTLEYSTSDNHRRTNIRGQLEWVSLLHLGLDKKGLRIVREEGTERDWKDCRAEPIFMYILPTSRAYSFYTFPTSLVYFIGVNLFVNEL